VDIVLNSLAGEAIDKNLSILRPFGRFVEIGLVDIYKNRRLGMRPLRKNVSLFAVDLSRVFDKPGDLPCTLLREAIGRFDGRTLTPLPYRVFPADRVPDAFRAMAQAQHIGKLVVSMQDRAGLRVQRGREKHRNHYGEKRCQNLSNITSPEPRIMLESASMNSSV